MARKAVGRGGVQKDRRGFQEVKRSMERIGKEIMEKNRVEKERTEQRKKYNQ